MVHYFVAAYCSMSLCQSLLPYSNREITLTLFSKLGDKFHLIGRISSPNLVGSLLCFLSNYYHNFMHCQQIWTNIHCWCFLLENIWKIHLLPVRWSWSYAGKELNDPRVLTDVGDVPVQEIRDCGVDDDRLMGIISESVKLVMEEVSPPFAFFFYYVLHCFLW